MPSLPSSTGLTITNPLVLYRALVATKRIDPDPAQHRLAIHLQKLYYRLKDYEPEVEYWRRLEDLSQRIGNTSDNNYKGNDGQTSSASSLRQRTGGLFSGLRAYKEQRDTLALTRTLTSHEAAMELNSPKGLLLHGEVGTGKSMLVDLLADSLPSKKKRRWHFNTFMLETLARLEELRHVRAMSRLDHNVALGAQEYSLLWLARDMITTSPILFLDEFQLPDRAASKIMSNLLTCFFQLGGVLVATSNRMPEELAKAAGVEFSAPPPLPLSFFGRRGTGATILGLDAKSGRSEGMFPGKGEMAGFLELLNARCESWNLEGGRDWRRKEAEEALEALESKDFARVHPDVEEATEHGHGHRSSVEFSTAPSERTKKDTKSKAAVLPKFYFISPPSITSTFSSNSSDNRATSTPDPALESQETEDAQDQAWQNAISHAFTSASPFPASSVYPPRSSVSASTPTPLPQYTPFKWTPSSIRVYGRTVPIPRTHQGIALFKFSELCSAALGPADYITLASTFHTFIITDIPVLTLALHRNEARRFITLLDALYEAKCKLLIRADAGPDDLFFPESTRRSATPAAASSSADTVPGDNQASNPNTTPTSSSAPSTLNPPSTPNIPTEEAEDVQAMDAVHPETFAEIHQDLTEPFRPNVSSDLAPRPSSESWRLWGSTQPGQAAWRSVLADEDADFGPIDRVVPDAGAQSTAYPLGHTSSSTAPNFAQTGHFTGEDERFAYKRARSRLWEMCGQRWWSRTSPTGGESVDAESSSHVAAGFEHVDEHIQQPQPQSQSQSQSQTQAVPVPVHVPVSQRPAWWTPVAGHVRAKWEGRDQDQTLNDLIHNYAQAQAQIPQVTSNTATTLATQHLSSSEAFSASEASQVHVSASKAPTNTITPSKSYPGPGSGKSTSTSTSPFRTHPDPPPRFSWTHIWGMMIWGRKAGIWGQGVDGLAQRRQGQITKHHGNDNVPGQPEHNGREK